MSKIPVKGNWLDKATLVEMREQFELKIDYFYEDLTGPNKEAIIQNNEKLKNGAAALSDGANKIADGVEQLDDGADELYNGVVKFNEEGISKLVDAFNGDAKDLIDRMDAVVQAGENYTTFTGLAKDQVGSVKFIIKTDAVKVSE